jgi:hypothetical protein
LLIQGTLQKPISFLHQDYLPDQKLFQVHFCGISPTFFSTLSFSSSILFNSTFFFFQAVNFSVTASFSIIKVSASETENQSRNLLAIGLSIGIVSFFLICGTTAFLLYYRIRGKTQKIHPDSVSQDNSYSFGTKSNISNYSDTEDNASITTSQGGGFIDINSEF